MNTYSPVVHFRKKCTNETARNLDANTAPGYCDFLLQGVLGNSSQFCWYWLVECKLTMSEFALTETAVVPPSQTKCAQYLLVMLHSHVTIRSSELPKVSEVYTLVRLF